MTARRLLLVPFAALLAVAVACTSSPPANRSAGGPSTAPSTTTIAPGGVVILAHSAGGPVPAAAGGKTEAGASGAPPVTTIAYPSAPMPVGASGGGAAPADAARGGAVPNGPTPAYYPPYYGAASGQGLSVSDYEDVSHTADGAVAFVAKGYDPANAGITADEKQRVASALADLNLPEGSIHYPQAGVYGPPGSTVEVDVPVDRLPAIANQVISRVNTIFNNQANAGVRYRYSGCPALVDQARSHALAAVRAQAGALAQAAGLTLGPIVGLSEQAPSYYPVIEADQAGAPPVDSRCETYAYTNYGPDANVTGDPVVHFSESLFAVFSLPGAATDAQGLSASGTGSATAQADGAEIEVFAPTPPEDRTDSVTQKIAALGIDPGAVHVDQPPYYGQIVVRVAVPLDKVGDLGPKIVATVTDVYGSINSQGVHYTVADCEAVHDIARQEALKDAASKASALAGAAGSKLGGVKSLSESGPWSPQGGAPCQPAKDATYGYGTAVVGFDAPAEVEVLTAVSALYAIG